MKIISIEEALNGTWISTDYGSEGEMRFNNGNFEVSMNGTPLQKGTYTTNGNSITVTLTHIHGSYFKSSWGLEAKWYSKNEVQSAIKSSAQKEGLSNEQIAMIDKMINEMFTSHTGTYSVSGNTLIMTFGDDDESEKTTTYTRK